MGVLFYELWFCKEWVFHAVQALEEFRICRGRWSTSISLFCWSDNEWYLISALVSTIILQDNNGCAREDGFMNQKERMLAGLPYKAWLDGLTEERLENKKRIYQYNNLEPDAFEKQDMLIRQILGKKGESVHIEAPFRCDYGYNIEVGENFYANYNLIILDVGKVRIGKNAQIAPNVSIYTAGHPIHPESRNSGYEYGIAVTIGDNVWIGGGVTILPGVSIGDSTVIAAASVVTKSFPDHVVIAGNPAKIIKNIEE